MRAHSTARAVSSVPREIRAHSTTIARRSAAVRLMLRLDHSTVTHRQSRDPQAVTWHCQRRLAAQESATAR